jgi:hypothetical protein
VVVVTCIVGGIIVIEATCVFWRRMGTVTVGDTGGTVVRVVDVFIGIGPVFRVIMSFGIGVRPGGLLPRPISLLPTVVVCTGNEWDLQFDPVF